MVSAVVYTDLDGTLLDHYDYSHAAADAMLAKLAQRRIPVVPCTSKTRAELQPLRTQLNNDHPFVVENGAAVLIPAGYFQSPPPGTVMHAGYLRHSFVEPRQHWLAMIERTGREFQGQYTAFSQMTTQDIVDLTGLDADSAKLAAEREYGEPLRWLGDSASRERFFAALQSQGARILQGGRFAHVSGRCDKGGALKWLNRVYAEQSGHTPTSIALGDGHNDIAMLEAADYAVVVRSPAHEPPSLHRSEGVIVTQAHGPAGWTEGLRNVLNKLDR